MVLRVQDPDYTYGYRDDRSDYVTRTKQAVKKKRIQKVKSQIDPQRYASAEFNLDNQKTFLEKGGKYTPGEIAEMERYTALKAKKSGMETLKGGGVAEGVGEDVFKKAADEKAKEGILSGGSKKAGLAGIGLQMAGMKTEAHNKQLEAKAELAKAQAQSTASAQKQKAMGQMGQAFQRYFS